MTTSNDKLTMPTDMAVFARSFNTIEQSREKRKARAARMRRAKKQR